MKMLNVTSRNLKPASTNLIVWGYNNGHLASCWLLNTMYKKQLVQYIWPVTLEVWPVWYADSIEPMTCYTRSIASHQIAKEPALVQYMLTKLENTLTVRGNFY